MTDRLTGWVNPDGVLMVDLRSRFDKEFLSVAPWNLGCMGLGMCGVVVAVWVSMSGTGTRRPRSARVLIVATSRRYYRINTGDYHRRAHDPPGPCGCATLGGGIISYP